MTRRAWLFCCLAALTAPACTRAEEGEATDLRLTLPPVCYAVAGVTFSIYYDNIVLTETPEAYTFRVECDLGSAEPRRWTGTPAAEQTGDHPLTITVSDEDGRLRQTARTVLHVAPADAGKGREVRLLMVGDSLTHATVYANEVARLFSLEGNPSWRMFGTHRPPGAAEGVAHEGYGGWSWGRFASHYEPDPDGTYRKMSSPFVFLDADGKPLLDVARYLAEKCAGEKPDVVTFLLGINDCFSADPDDPANIDARIDAMFAQADRLLSAFRGAAPDADLGICLTTPPNSRESGFEANYQGKYHRWGWKRIQHRIVERLIEKYQGREDEELFIVPTELNLDPVDGYPENNGVHPNAFGYKQVGASLYGWLKWRLEATD